MLTRNLPQVLMALVAIVLIITMGSVSVLSDTDAAITENAPQCEIFQPDNDKGYIKTNHVIDTPFGGTLSDLRIEAETVEQRGQTDDGVDIYALAGSDVLLSLGLNFDVRENYYINDSKWRLSSDTWNGEVLGMGKVGNLGTGAFTVRTSADGQDWVRDADAGIYSNGLFSTDYAEKFGAEANEIYRPSFDMLSRGIYVEVSYIYEIYRVDTVVEPYWIFWTHEVDRTTFVNVVESYTFFLILNDLDAAKFHNLSVSDQIQDYEDPENGLTSELIYGMETMSSGSMTTTGFEVSIRDNPNLTVEVALNGSLVDFVLDPITKSCRFIEDGLYTIYVTTPLGDTEVVTIYVDKRPLQDVFVSIFGENILHEAERHVADGDYPVYSTGVIYEVFPTSSSTAPLCMSIINVYTGEMFEGPLGWEGRKGTLDEPGLYQIIVYDNETYSTDDPSGDSHTFTFTFELTDDSNAPRLNYNSLIEYNRVNIPDASTGCWGVEYGTRGNGKVMVLYDSLADANEAASRLVREDVTEVPGRGWTYTGVLSDDRTVYSNDFDLTQAVNAIVRTLVSEVVIDMSDPNTYRTLDPETLASVEDLRELRLEIDVTVFADEVVRDAMTMGGMPVISSKPFEYVVSGDGGLTYGETESGVNSFIFKKDAYGYDSESVKIRDSNGRLHDISYDVSVGDQLNRLGVETGIITVYETNIYGKERQYNCYFIAEGRVSSELGIVLTDGGISETVGMTQDSDITTLRASSFTVGGDSSLMDPYERPVVSVFDSQGNLEYRSMFGEEQKTFTNVGAYTVQCSNCTGEVYGFTVELEPEGDADDAMGGLWMWVAAILAIIVIALFLVVML